MATIDSPKDIRSGEELDTAKLSAYLRQVLPEAKGVMKILQFPSGFSNLTYLVTLESREFILRRPPFGKKAKTAHDMKREYTILKSLRPDFPYAPEPLAYCDDPAVMDAPFYLMERIKGIILRKNFPKEMVLNEADVGLLCENFMRIFTTLHRLDYRKCGLESLGQPEGYVRRQVEGWSRRFRDARTPDVPDFEAVMEWLAATMPPDSPKPGLIHNDYKFDNVVLNPDNPLEIVGVVDWEMATIGDPLMDLGASLAYWVNRDDPDEVQLIRTLPTTVPGMLSRRQIVDLYADMSGIAINNFDFYYCYGLFRLAVIAQQIYYRYYHGQTKDERFKLLSFAVSVLEKAARGVMEGKGI
ncbi:MAG: phosphotransferase family protein [Desulfobacterales bacterium CG23_combo_of_CG06-09_8_20_14_all_51_8]|nr:MAG: phosphotransferase family protein [Desulfobacterales bacterium CG23_combo_of_CG06-09_8_20_14_all_51_8]